MKQRKPPRTLTERELYGRVEARAIDKTLVGVETISPGLTPRGSTIGHEVLITPSAAAQLRRELGEIPAVQNIENSWAEQERRLTAP